MASPIYKCSFFHFSVALILLLIFIPCLAGLKVGSLVMAASDDGLCGRLEEILGRRTSSKVDFSCKVDPELIGGFVLELDGYRLDASARSALDRIRRRLVDEGNRIV